MFSDLLTGQASYFTDILSGFPVCGFLADGAGIGATGPASAAPAICPPGFWRPWEYSAGEAALPKKKRREMSFPETPFLELSISFYVSSISPANQISDKSPNTVNLESFVSSGFI